MLLQHQENLEELLVRWLAQRPAVSANWLHEQTRRLARSYTIQAVYKELRKLQRVGVVVKVGERYSLRLTWVDSLARWAGDMQRTYDATPLMGAPLVEGQRKAQWTFTDLGRMDDFILQLIVALLRQSSERVLFEWVPHPWFELIHHRDDVQLAQYLRNKNSRIFLIVGGRSYLDRSLAGQLPKDVYSCSLAVSEFEAERRVHYLLIGDYLVTVQLDKHSAARIDELFKSVSAASDLRVSRVLSVFNQRARCRVTLERKPTTLVRMRRKFEQYFGVLAARG